MEYKKAYEEIHKTLISELKNRFSDESIDAICMISNVLNVNRSLPVTEYEIESKLIMYKEFINFRQLLNEINILESYSEQTGFKNEIKNSKHLTYSELLRNFLNKEKLSKILPNFSTLFRIYLKFPISSATGERSFSCLKRIKTWLRNTIGQERLSSLAILNIEKDILINLDEVGRKFCEIKDGRIKFLFN
jgi:hypothetical protein